MTTEAVVNCHERGLGRTHRWEGGGVCVRCGADRDQKIVAALASGVPAARVAETVGLSKRSVWRAAERVREGKRLLSPQERARLVSEGRKADTNTSPAIMRAVAAALEEGRVRHVGQRAAREVPERCPRCGGSVIAEHDEDGDLDAYCIACGRRTGAPTAEEAEALRRELHEADFVTVKRSNGPRRNGGRL
ncbi:MAG: hypothetical protein M0R75_15955 [Dehalococcoidia bacterium]|nr:hypothetical protein [Dehalococcoidia bacterium]